MATELVEISDSTTVEELGRQARAVRDALDPIGAEERYRLRYEQRSFTLRAGVLADAESVFAARQAGVRVVQVVDRERSAADPGEHDSAPTGPSSGTTFTRFNDDGELVPAGVAARTDIDRGILLCRFHHLHLHNNHWRITRERRGPFPPHRFRSAA